MMRQVSWVLSILLAVACGGRSRVDGNATGGSGDTRAGAANASGGASGAGSSGAGSSGAGSSGAGNTGSCPDSEPSEGASCPSPGVSCNAYGSLSCPETALCSADSKWRINCPGGSMLGACSCPHHDYGHPPNEHRATAVECSHTRAASLPTPNGNCGGATCPNSDCSQDSDCVDGAQGTNGRCLQRGPLAGLTCSYDACFADTACVNGSVCQCREPLDGVEPNYCTAGNCRIDADCGMNGYCSPSQAHEWCSTFYACHTPNDECTNDSDCGADTHCDFAMTEKRWVCANLCGPVPL